MDSNWHFTFTLRSRQDDDPARTPLTSEERRRLLEASLRILTYRYRAGQQISQNDLNRVARLFADDAEPEVVGRLVLGADGSSPGP